MSHNTWTHGMVRPLVRPLASSIVTPNQITTLRFATALIAFGLKVVGALLIVALLVVPPAAARPFARTPEGMAVLAALVGAASAPLGLLGAYAADAPAGPAIVLAAVALFASLSLAARLVKR